MPAQRGPSVAAHRDAGRLAAQALRAAVLLAFASFFCIPLLWIVLSFAADWNNFFLPYAVLPDSAQYPVEVGLSDLLMSASRPMLALAALIAALPVAVVFFVSERALARGLVGDAASS